MVSVGRNRVNQNVAPRRRNTVCPPHPVPEVDGMAMPLAGDVDILSIARQRTDRGIMMLVRAIISTPGSEHQATWTVPAAAMVSYPAMRLAVARRYGVIVACDMIERLPARQRQDMWVALLDDSDIGWTGGRQS